MSGLKRAYWSGVMFLCLSPARHVHPAKIIAQIKAQTTTSAALIRTMKRNNWLYNRATYARLNHALG